MPQVKADSMKRKFTFRGKQGMHKELTEQSDGTDVSLETTHWKQSVATTRPVTQMVLGSQKRLKL